MSDYRNLEIWQRARVLSIRVYKLIQKLPRTERLQLGDQLLRAAFSIRNNIVEGSGFGSDAQFARYLGYAIQSADETQDEIRELDELDLLPTDDRDLLTEPSEITAMLVSFRKKLL